MHFTFDPHNGILWNQQVIIAFLERSYRRFWNRLIDTLSSKDMEPSSASPSQDALRFMKHDRPKNHTAFDSKEHHDDREY